MGSKKGFEIQFNWIFVLIIGAAILLFFTSLVFRQKDLSDAAAKTTLLIDIESLVEGASASLDTTNLIAIPKSKIDISCNKISIGGTSRQYQNMILFAPSSMQGSKLVAQTFAFNTPYRAANILYMTSQEMRYILIGDSDFAKEINKNLPAELSKENYPAYDAPSIKNLNNYKVRFIFVNKPFSATSPMPGDLAKMPDADVTALKIINGDNEKGTIEFYNKKGNTWELKGSSAYPGKQSLIGAVYTDTEEAYSCNMNNVISRVKLVNDVYKKRSNSIAGCAGLTPAECTSISSACKGIHNTALAKFNTIAANLLAFPGFSLGNAGNIAAASRDLSAQNKEAQKFSCPLIY